MAAVRALEIVEAQIAVQRALQGGAAGDVVSAKRDASVLVQDGPLTNLRVGEVAARQPESQTI